MPPRGGVARGVDGLDVRLVQLVDSDADFQRDSRAFQPVCGWARTDSYHHQVARNCVAVRGLDSLNGLYSRKRNHPLAGTEVDPVLAVQPGDDLADFRPERRERM